MKFVGALASLAVVAFAVPLATASAAQSSSSPASSAPAQPAGQPSPPYPPQAAQPIAPTGPALTPRSSAAAPAPGPSTMDLINNAKLTDHGVKDGVDPAVLRAEVMLDRVHVSPGVIDGRDGANFQHALETYEKQRHLKVSHGLDEKVWASLLAEAGGPVLMEHELTEKEVAGPFFPDLPRDYSKLAQMRTLGYRSVDQKLGGEFHMGEKLLAALNPGADLSKAGTKILVADTASKPVHGRLSRIVVDKTTRQVLGYDKRGHVMVAFPATIGSRELPSPSGTYKVKGVAWNPIYYYDPKNFVQGDNKEKLKLPPGPNNPVGSVFIALTKPTYGLHGTPDPSEIDKTASHGCVRMTNWDARELAHLVHHGMVVHFKG